MSILKTKNKNLLSESDINETNIKARVTTYIDLDIVKALKAEAKRKKVGYQTLLNQKLRQSVFKSENIEERVKRIEKYLKIVK
jgi:uncharacterized protein (DUF4415 family)